MPTKDENHTSIYILQYHIIIITIDNYFHDRTEKNRTTRLLLYKCGQRNNIEIVRVDDAIRDYKITTRDTRTAADVTHN